MLIRTNTSCVFLCSVSNRAHFNLGRLESWTDVHVAAKESCLNIVKCTTSHSIQCKSIAQKYVHMCKGKLVQSD